MRINNDTLLDNASVSGNLQSDAYSLKHLVVYSATATFTGSPDGYISLEASNDVGDNSTPSVWVTITKPETSRVQIVSASDKVIWNYSNAGYRWLRVNWERTSGTCGIKIQINGKGL